MAYMLTVDGLWHCLEQESATTWKRAPSIVFEAFARVKLNRCYWRKGNGMTNCFATMRQTVLGCRVMAGHQTSEQFDLALLGISCSWSSSSELWYGESTFEERTYGDLLRGKHRSSKHPFAPATFEHDSEECSFFLFKSGLHITRL